MAYAATVSGPFIYTSADGKRFYRYTVSETEAGPATEYQLPSFPPLATLVYIQCIPSAGTVQPAFSRAAGILAPGNKDFCAQQSAAAAYIRDQSPAEFSGVIGGIVYGHSVVGGGVLTANVETELHFVEGTP